MIKKHTGHEIYPNIGDVNIGVTSIHQHGDVRRAGARRIVKEADLDEIIANGGGEGRLRRTDMLQLTDSEDETYPVGSLLDEFERMGVTPTEFMTMPDKRRRKVVADLRARMRHRVDPEADDMQRRRQKIIEILEKPLVMEKPQGSSFHHFLQAGHYGVADEMPEWIVEKFQLFVIEHDWAKAFSGSGDFSGGEIPMPFDYTCFEMRISGMRILVMVGPERDVFMALGFDGIWTGRAYKMAADGTLELDYSNVTDIGKEETMRFIGLIRDQIRAVCIMLDAEVAEVELRRAPERLNRKREREGRSLLRDFHVVRLAHRHRVRAAEMRADDAPGTRKRLHFRRGHDRHYPNYKVWIKWQLVGDPDLGFVDKEYRL